MKIDLHMHTSKSDGADTPEEFLAKVRAAGIDLFSVTDHDTNAGALAVAELLAAEAPADGQDGQTGQVMKRGDLRFLPGIEFSCKDAGGKYHILGYGYDPEHPDFLATLAEVRRVRLAKAEGRVAFLKETFGIVLPEEELQKFYALESPTKPVLADIVAACGFAEDRQDAMGRFIDKFKHEFYLRPEKAIEGILAAGGVPVLAHPSFGDGGQYITGKEMEDRLRRLMDFGLEGLEVFYSEFTPELIAELLGYAEKYDLYVTAGSDYHGTEHHGPMGITHLTAEEEWPAGLLRFLERVGCSGRA